MNLFGAAMEAGYALILMVLVVAMVFGWKPKLATGLKLGVAFGVLYLVVLFFLQEREVILYITTCVAIFLPMLYTHIAARMPAGENESVKRYFAVYCAAGLWAFFEIGFMPKNYTSALLITVILIPVFLWWRNPKEEGFIKTKLTDWRWAASALCFFFSATILMVMVGWGKVMATAYPGKLKWIPLISVIPFFLVKAIPEELVFRGIFQGALKDKFGFLPALFGAALLYGAAALNDPSAWAFPNWHAAVNALALGLACGFVYEKTKSLAVSGVVNAVVSFSWYMLFAKGGY